MLVLQEEDIDNFKMRRSEIGNGYSVSYKLNKEIDKPSEGSDAVINRGNLILYFPGVFCYTHGDNFVGWEDDSFLSEDYKIIRSEEELVKEII